MCQEGETAPSGSPGAFGDSAVEICGRFGLPAISRVFGQEGPALTISYQKPVPFAGWLLVNPEGGADSSDFAVYASNHNASEAEAVPEGEWKLVGTPSWTVVIREMPTDP